MDIGNPADELQQLIKTKRLLENPDFIEYIEKVKELYNFKCEQIFQLTGKPLTTAEVEVLNQHICERNALGTLVIVRDELAESISPPEQALNPSELVTE